MAWNLKDEKDVKLYLENLGIEYRFGCYHEKKPEVCHLLGDYLEAIKKDWQKAAKVYQVNCDEYSYGHSCYKFGNYAYMGKGSLKVDHNKATKYYDKGCSLKYPDACLHAGLMRTSQSSEVLFIPVPKDHKLAYENFLTGCRLKSNMCCFYLSGMFISGIEGVLKKDMSQAFEHSLSACELGNMYACANLAQMYKKGEGVAKSDEKAEEYKQRAIEMQDQVVKQFRTIAFEEGG